MCGITAWYKTGNETIFSKKVFSKTFNVIKERGMHASGVACLSLNKIKILKDAVPSSKLIGYKNFNNIINNPDILMGHTRYATHGDSKDNKNNHPHYTADMRYVLIHNGVVMDELPEIEIEGECDSEKLLRLIEKYGISEGFKKIGALKNASYAIMLIDTQRKSFYVFRNTSPAWYIDLSFETGGILFASTKELLLKGIRKAGILSYKNNALREIKSGMLYKWSEKKKEPETWKIKLAERKTTVTWKNYHRIVNREYINNDIENNTNWWNYRDSLYN